MQKLPIITKTSEIDIKSVYGQSIFDFYPQLKKILIQQTNGNELSQFFSEPVVNNVRGEVTWFSTVSGSVRGIPEMTAEERQRVGEQIKSFSQMVKDAANHLEAMSGPKALGVEALRNLLVTPNLANSLFLVGDKLVIAQWGCVPHGIDPKDFDIVTQGKNLIPPEQAIIAPLPGTTPVPPPEDETPPSPPPTTPSPPPEPVAATTSTPTPAPATPVVPPIPPEPVPPVPPLPLTPTEILWRWLVILLLCLLLLFGLLTKSCTYGVLAPSDNESRLRTDISELWVKVQQKAASCFPNDSGLHHDDGKNTHPQSESNNVPQSESQNLPNLPPVLNEESLKKNDLKVFEGKWKLVTPLVNRYTEEPITILFDFDKSGKGNQMVNHKSGKTCTGTASASIVSGTSFKIDMGACSGAGKQYSYPAELAPCELMKNPNQAQCILACADGPCNATFERY